MEKPPVTGSLNRNGRRVGYVAWHTWIYNQ
jgi:hypothetical protein